MAQELEKLFLNKVADMPQEVCFNPSPVRIQLVVWLLSVSIVSVADKLHSEVGDL